MHNEEIKDTEEAKMIIKTELECMDKNLRIVDDFLNKYYRSPTKNEFSKLGGNLDIIERLYGGAGYLKFLTSNGYDRPIHERSKVVQIFNDRGSLIFEGLVSQAAEYLEVWRSTIIKAALYGIKIKWKYSVKYKDLSTLR